MSKLVRKVKEKRKMEAKKAVVNFMGGTSYEINPLDTLKMVTASSIFGEPSYYRDGIFDGAYAINSLFKAFSILDPFYDGMKTSDIMEDVIDMALDYDFEATLRWAVELRNDYYMRLNPQVIMVRAAMHPKRVEFNKNNPSVFSELIQKVMSRADEPASQFAYYLYLNGSKSNCPNVLKKNWAKKLESLNRYQLHKYKNTGLGMIDVVRVSHAHSKDLDELMKTGTITISENETTWESYISQNGSSQETWEWVIDNLFTKEIEKHSKNTFEHEGKIFMASNHMAILRNLRNMATFCDADHIKKVLKALKAGVLTGKQFPFRYYTAMNMIENAAISQRLLIMDALEECINISCENMPKLKGKTMCLSDNSGSAWGSLNSEYGRVTVAEIDNLSSVITARNSEEGYVGVFGDKLEVKPIKKTDGVLSQTKKVTKDGQNVGMGTENGIWLFFKDAISNKEHWDNIFIYSDMQAGHGGLFGIADQMEMCQNLGCTTGWSNRHIDVAKLIDIYRKEVNPDVNVFCVQTAGYNNVLVPEYGYRTNIMYGWTGKELVFADEMISLWNEVQSRKH